MAEIRCSKCYVEADPEKTAKLTELALEVCRLQKALAEERRIADNLALLCYASGCGIGTTTMQEYEAMKQARTPREVGK